MSRAFGEVILKICPAKSPIESIACTSDSRKLIVGQVANGEPIPTLSVVDINTGNIDKVIEQSDNFDNTVWRLVLDKTDSFVVYLKQVYNKYHIISCSLKTGEKKKLMETENSDKYKGFEISPANEFVIGIDNVIQFWDIEKGEKKREIQLEEIDESIAKDPYRYTSLSFTLDGKVMAVGGLKEGEVLLYDYKERTIINRYMAAFGYPRQVYFDSREKYLFVLDYWGKGMFIWNLKTQKRHLDILFNEDWCGITCLDCDKKNTHHVVMGMISSIVTVMDIEKPGELCKDDIHEGRVYNVFFTPDGKKLVSSGEDWQIIVRNAE